MALDTRSKRASSVRLGQPWMVAVVLPDGNLQQNDRQHQALTYAGILSALFTGEGHRHRSYQVCAMVRMPSMRLPNPG